MTAEEMFEEIDFVCIFEDYDIINYERDGEVTVTFYKLDKSVEFKNVNYITLSLHKAITKQMEELKWL